MLLVHDRFEQACEGAIHAQTVIDNTWPIVFKHRAKQSHISTNGFDFESVRALLRGLHFCKTGSNGLACGRDVLRMEPSGSTSKFSATRSRPELDFEAR